MAYQLPPPANRFNSFGCDYLQSERSALFSRNFFRNGGRKCGRHQVCGRDQHHARHSLGLAVAQTDICLPHRPIVRQVVQQPTPDCVSKSARDVRSRESRQAPLPGPHLPLTLVASAKRTAPACGQRILPQQSNEEIAPCLDSSRKLIVFHSINLTYTKPRVIAIPIDNRRSISLSSTNLVRRQKDMTKLENRSAAVDNPCDGKAKSPYLSSHWLLEVANW